MVCKWQIPTGCDMESIGNQRKFTIKHCHNNSKQKKKITKKWSKNKSDRKTE